MQPDTEQLFNVLIESRANYPVRNTQSIAKGNGWRYNYLRTGHSLLFAILVHICESALTCALVTSLWHRIGCDVNYDCLQLFPFSILFSEAAILLSAARMDCEVQYDSASAH